MIINVQSGPKSKPNQTYQDIVLKVAIDKAGFSPNLGIEEALEYYQSVLNILCVT